MKKILIFSLCVFFSVEAASGMKLPENATSSNSSLSANPQNGDSPILSCKTDDKGNIQSSINAKVIASFSNDLYLCIYPNSKPVELDYGVALNSTAVLVNEKLKKRQQLPPAAQAVLQTLCCDLKGEGTIEQIAVKVFGITSGYLKAQAKEEKWTRRNLENKETSKLLNKMGIKIWKLPSGNNQEYRIYVDDKTWNPTAVENPPTTVEIPVTKVDDIYTVSGDSPVYYYENECLHILRNKKNTVGNKTYFTVQGGKIQEINSVIGGVALGVSEGIKYFDSLIIRLGTEKIMIVPKTVLGYIKAYAGELKFYKSSSESVKLDDFLLQLRKEKRRPIDFSGLGELDDKGSSIDMTLPGGGMLHCSDKDKKYELEKGEYKVLLFSSAAKILAYILKYPGCGKEEINKFVTTWGICKMSSVESVIATLRRRFKKLGIGITDGHYGYEVYEVIVEDKEINLPEGFTLKRYARVKGGQYVYKNVQYVLTKGSQEVDLTLNQKKVLESIWDHQEDGGATTQQIMEGLWGDRTATDIGGVVCRLNLQLNELGLQIENKQDRYKIIESPLNGFKSSSKALEEFSSTSVEFSGENLLRQRAAAEKRMLPPVMALLGEDSEDSDSEYEEPAAKHARLEFSDFGGGASCAQWTQHAVNDEHSAAEKGEQTKSEVLGSEEEIPEAKRQCPESDVNGGVSSSGSYKK